MVSNSIDYQHIGRAKRKEQPHPFPPGGCVVSGLTVKAKREYSLCPPRSAKTRIGAAQRRGIRLLNPCDIQGIFGAKIPAHCFASASKGCEMRGDCGVHSLS